MKDIELGELLEYADFAGMSLEDALDDLVASKREAEQAQNDAIREEAKREMTEKLEAMEGTTLLSRITTRFLKDCYAQGKLPTEGEMDVILKLDALDRYYNG